MTTAHRLYDQHTLVAADYAESSEWPMKATAYDPLSQVVWVDGRCRYPRFDGKQSDAARQFWLDKILIDPYDLRAGPNGTPNGSNRTQLVSNDLSNTFCAFLPGETKWTSFVTELSGEGLPKIGNKTGDYSQIMQWKSIRADGTGSDPYLALYEAHDGLVFIYNANEFWKSRGGTGTKAAIPIPGDFKGRQIKLVLEACFSDTTEGLFRLSGELTGDPTKRLRDLIPYTRFPTLSPSSPGATLSWGPYQETWLPSVTRRYWDVEVLS